MGTTKEAPSFQFPVSSGFGLLSSPFRLAKGWGTWALRSGRGKQSHRQRGLWVVLLGPDGAGKSAVIAGIGDGVAAGFAGSAAYHLRPALTGEKRLAKANGNPHGQRPRGMLVTLGKLAYLLVANWLGYLTRVRPRVRRGALVVFDRYFPDGLVDPQRYRLPRSSGWMVRLMEKLVPRPDLYVVLDAPATVLRERKQEVTFFEVDRQCREYRRLAERLPNAVTVDASQSLDRVVYEVLECSIERHLVRHRAFNEA